MEHTRDQRLHFDPATHTYTLDGSRALMSVTRVIDTYFPAFNADIAIQKLKRRGTHPLAHHSPEEIKRLWEEKARKGQEAGTHLHKAIEAYLEGQPGSDFPAEFQYIDQLRDQGLGDLAATEWSIFDEGWGIAGTLDALFHKEGQYRLIDWKRSIIKQRNGWEKAHPPIAHLDACNFEKYALQMTLYGLILERQYQLATAQLAPMMVQLHPDRPFAAFTAADRRRETLAMMAHFCQQQPA